MLFEKLSDSNLKQKLREDSMYKPMLDCLKKCLESSNEIEKGYTYKDYTRFLTTGSRREYEDKYFKYYRCRLTCSAILYFVYETEEYYDILVEAIWDICNEYTWCLPSHSADLTEPEDIFNFIDLFAAETGHAMAEILYLLGDKLPTDLVKRVKFELDRRIFKSFESRSFWWENVQMNWAAVCAGSVGMAYLYERPDEFNKVKSRIYAALDNFLSGFSEEGVCFEGLSYWNYGFGHYIYFADLLYNATNGKEDLLHRDIVEKVAHFQQKIFIANSIVSFSDCIISTTYQPGLTCRLAKLFDGIYIPANATPDLVDECSRFAESIRNLLWLENDIETSYELGTEYMKDAGWYVERQKNFSFAAKAGHNDEPHNHNDVGCFIIADQSGQVLVDHGSGLYTRQYFAPETRYDYLCNSSRGHSVPEIDKTAQHAGREYAAKNVIFNEKGFSMDMAKAYPLPELKTLNRSFKVSENEVELKDLYEFNDTEKHHICERFVSMQQPERTSDGVKIGNLILKSDFEPEFSQGMTTNHNTGAPETLYFTEYRGDFREFILKIVWKN